MSVARKGYYVKFTEPSHQGQTQVSAPMRTRFEVTPLTKYNKPANRGLLMLSET